MVELNITIIPKHYYRVVTVGWKGTINRLMTFGTVNIKAERS